MKKLVFTFVSALMLISFVPATAGLDWNIGTLTNADGRDRNASAIAYDPGGAIFVAGTEENSSGNKFIIIKKYSSTGTLLVTHTNSYFIPAGTVISDGAKSISIDASGNVYVLGTQFGSSSRQNDIVLIKYNSSLSMQWKKLIYNTGYPTASFIDVPCKLAFDASGNIYVSGTWYNAVTSDDDQIFVRKYNSAGTEIFTTAIAENFIVVNGIAADMCIDNSLNVTVVAKTNVSGVDKLVFARVNSVGAVSWIKYYEPTPNYSFMYEPQIEATTAGTFYISSVLYRVGSPAITPYYNKLTISKFSSLGIKDWEIYTPELNSYPFSGTLRLDASNNIYAGYNYSGTSGSGPGKYSLFKYNSGGSQLWNVVAPETYTQFLTFETYSSTHLFLSFFDPTAGDPKLRKIDAQNGSTIWTENVTVVKPLGYTLAWEDARAIAINPSTSELAYCGIISGQLGAPSYATEQRWNIRKYGATSPRLAATEIQEENLDISVEAFPNPASEFINIRFSENSYPNTISIYDTQGKLLKQFSGNITSENTIPVYDLPDGIIFIRSEFENATTISKVVIQK